MDGWIGGIGGLGWFSWVIVLLRASSGPTDTTSTLKRSAKENNFCTFWLNVTTLNCHGRLLLHQVVSCLAAAGHLWQEDLHKINLILAGSIKGKSRFETWSVQMSITFSAYFVYFANSAYFAYFVYFANSAYFAHFEFSAYSCPLCS